MKNVESPPRNGDRPPFDLDSAAYDGPRASCIKEKRKWSANLFKRKVVELGLVQSRDVVVCQHTIAAAPPLRHAIAVHLRYAKSRGKWQR